ncbi:MAG: hypothetical protein KDK40_02820 [Chlamydiia bacterium]|nr:hypothetical protein [Chlamydiia bacterium]
MDSMPVSDSNLFAQPLNLPEDERIDLSALFEECEPEIAPDSQQAPLTSMRSVSQELKGRLKSLAKHYRAFKKKHNKKIYISKLTFQHLKALRHLWLGKHTQESAQALFSTLALRDGVRDIQSFIYMTIPIVLFSQIYGATQKKPSPLPTDSTDELTSLRPSLKTQRSSDRYSELFRDSLYPCLAYSLQFLCFFTAAEVFNRAMSSNSLTSGDFSYQALELFNATLMVTAIALKVSTLFEKQRYYMESLSFGLFLLLSFWKYTRGSTPEEILLKC